MRHQPTTKGYDAMRTLSAVQSLSSAIDMLGFALGHAGDDPEIAMAQSDLRAILARYASILAAETAAAAPRTVSAPVRVISGGK